MAFNRKKQLYASEVEALIKELTGFEENEKNFQEVTKYFYQNIIHHTFLTVDKSSVQRSINGIVEKFHLHALKERGNRLQKLVERYVTADLSVHSELQWNVLLLLLRLSFKPLSVPDESLIVEKPSLQRLSVKENDEINWPEYLKEGLEKFSFPNDDSDVWSEEEEEEEEEEEDNDKSKGGYGLPACKLQRPASTILLGYGGVPHPSLWRQNQKPLTQRETIQSICRAGVKSEHWLRGHVQNSWWADHSCRSNPESQHPVAHTCEIWEKTRQRSRPVDSGKPWLLVVSEYKLLQEVLWMLQTPTITSIFRKDSEGNFCVAQGVSLTSTIPDSLALNGFCSYFSMVSKLKEFQKTLNSLEMSDTRPPLTIKAYCAELMQQMHDLNKTVVNLETRLTKQEETVTLLSVGEELQPSLKKLHYLYSIHTRATRDWKVNTPWLQVTRLLSVLYEAFLEANDCTFLETSLSLFMHSFHVYLDIIDVWLSEGRLEDWRGEFLLTKRDDCVEVMPYEQEMCQRGVVPVMLLTKLVKVVKHAGFTMEIVSQLNKLTELRDTVQNKGCLFKEFTNNVKNELRRIKGMMVPSVFVSETQKSTSSLAMLDKTVAEENQSKMLNGVSSESFITTLDTHGSIVAGDTIHRDLPKTKEDLPFYLSATSTKTLYKQTMSTFLSNPLLAESLKDYCGSQTSRQLPTSMSLYGLPPDSMTLLGVACLHRALERQVELVETRLQIASRLVMKVVCEDYNLLQHFIVLRNVFFMESGFLAQRFYTYFFKEIMSDQWRNRVNLTVHLQDCVAEWFPAFRSHISVHIHKTKVEDPVQAAIQAISIAYTVDWPVSMVISDNAIESYNKVFRFLLHLKYAFWVLQEMRFSDLSECGSTRRVRRLHILKMWMYHSTNTLHSYFMGLVLRKYSDRLDQSVTQANSISDIIEAHNQYLVEVKTHCLQFKKSHIETFIMKLVWQCQDLMDLWMLESSGSLRDSDVSDLEQQYLAVYMGLTHCLEAVTAEMEDELDPLYELKAEFVNSTPEPCPETIS